MEVAKNLLSSKLQREESVLSVTGARGDATQQWGSPHTETQPRCKCFPLSALARVARCQ